MKIDTDQTDPIAVGLCPPFARHAGEQVGSRRRILVKGDYPGRFVLGRKVAALIERGRDADVLPVEDKRNVVLARGIVLNAGEFVLLRMVIDDDHLRELRRKLAQARGKLRVRVMCHHHCNDVVPAWLPNTHESPSKSLLQHEILQKALETVSETAITAAECLPNRQWPADEGLIAHSQACLGVGSFFTDE